MPDYSKSIIYKIVCKDPIVKGVYVGSTCNTIYKRKNEHKSCCNNINNKSYNINVYKYIRENNGFNNFEIIEIEKYEALDKVSLHKRERYWLEELQADLNKCIPYSNKKESAKKYKDNNKEKIKLYNEKNKDYIKDYKQKYYQINKDYKKKKVITEDYLE